jgi:hypothetical protein
VSRILGLLLLGIGVAIAVSLIAGSTHDEHWFIPGGSNIRMLVQAVISIVIGLSAMLRFDRDARAE